MATRKALYANIALIFCNVIWACDYPFYSLILGKYVSPIAMVSASLVIAALFSLIPLIWEKAERIEPKDRLKIIGAAILMGMARKLCMMYGLASTSSIDGSIISTTTPLLVLVLSVAAGIEHLSRTKSIGLILGMAGTIAIIIASNSGIHQQSSAVGNILIVISACAATGRQAGLRSQRP